MINRSGTHDLKESHGVMLTSRGPKEETHKNQLGEQLPLHNIGEAISSSEPHDSYL